LQANQLLEPIHEVNNLSADLPSETLYYRPLHGNRVRFPYVSIYLEQPKIVDTGHLSYLLDRREPHNEPEKAQTYKGHRAILDTDISFYANMNRQQYGAAQIAVPRESGWLFLVVRDKTDYRYGLRIGWPRSHDYFGNPEPWL